MGEESVYTPALSLQTECEYIYDTQRSPAVRTLIDLTYHSKCLRNKSDLAYPSSYLHKCSKNVGATSIFQASPYKNLVAAASRRPCPR